MDAFQPNDVAVAEMEVEPDVAEDVVAADAATARQSRKRGVEWEWVPRGWVNFVNLVMGVVVGVTVD